MQGVQIIVSTDDSIAAFATTKSDGAYSVSNIADGKYTVEASMTGYTTATSEVSISGDTQADFTLKSDNKVLDTLVVEAERPRITTPTGHIYYLSKKARECGNPFKALQEIPDIISNSLTQSVTSTDGQKLLILIDGVRIHSGIAPIDPKRIDYVEINDVVSGRYMREGVQKILNIHLKPQKSAYQFYEFGLRNDFINYYGETWGKFEIGNDKLSLYADFGPVYEHDHTTKSSSMVTTDSYRRMLDNESKSSGETYDYTLMMKYLPTKKDYLAVYFQGNNNVTRSAADGTGTFENLAGSLPAGVVPLADARLPMAMQSQADEALPQPMTTDYRGRNRSNIYAGTLFYRHIFSDKMTFENYASGTYNYNKLGTSSHDFYPDNKWTYATDFRTRRATFNMSTDFTWDVKDNMTLSLGSLLMYTNDHLRDNMLTMPEFVHKEWNEYLYASLFGSAGRFKYSLHAGASGFWRRSAGVYDEFYRPYGVASLTYDLKSAGSLMVRYILNSASPDVAMLNPYNTSTDSLRRNVGNPYLKPQNTQGVMMQYSYFSNGLYLGFMSNYNYISDRYETIGSTDADGVYTSTYDNLGHYSNLTFLYMASYRTVNTMTGLTASHRMNYFTGQHPKHSLSLNAYIMQTINKWSIYANVGYTNYDYTNISRTRNLTPSSQIMVSYNFTPNLSLSVGTDYVVRYNKTKTYVTDVNYEQITTTRNDVFHPYILFRWTIRKNEKKKMDLDNSIIKSLQPSIDLQDREY